ncbi:hypothetical protein ACFFOS_08835 [Nocardioides kongjuensis]|uniref:Uncharacterized protein n=1 Tax=Nocardioides kongjuensis TaxID=349522 RepID=A0A852RD05_9ACTN|nr:hypothetical protein [Nocardioides kongjuensis]NYD31077.1 hypothetical protein [Nocardioides kongjuensis]
MKPLLVLGALIAGAAALRAASRRLASHQTVLPALTTKVNTRVTRINQP